MTEAHLGKSLSIEEYLAVFILNRFWILADSSWNKIAMYTSAIKRCIDNRAVYGLPLFPAVEYYIYPLLSLLARFDFGSSLLIHWKDAHFDEIIYSVRIIMQHLTEK
jgi:hypothetical protein